MPGKPDNIRPTLQYSVLCDGVAQPPQFGSKFVLIGVFANLLRPSVIPQFFIVNRWINGKGEHTQQIVILKPDLSEFLRDQPQNFNLASQVHSADLIEGFVNINFDEPGVYWIKVELDGEAALSYPFPVFEEKQSPQAAS